MSHKWHLLTELYDQGEGLATVTRDLVFKKLLLDSPKFLRCLLQTTLPLPGDIVAVKAVNPELVSIKRKTFVLDLLLHVTVWAAGSHKRHVVNVEVASSADKETISKCGAYGARLYSEQIPKGSNKKYHLMPKVHCLAIIKTKAPEFSDIELYHHHHAYHNLSDAAAQARFPGALAIPYWSLANLP